MSISVEQLAADLHRHYRACFKALHVSSTTFGNCEGNHDHGWSHCHKQKYFRLRAARELLGKLPVKRKEPKPYVPRCAGYCESGKCGGGCYEY